MRRLAPLPFVCLFLCLPAAASAAEDIEAVWSFSGGQVAFQPVSEGSTTFAGTVIRPTSLSSCTHPVGEKMEIDVVKQPDGQWFGLHQWFNTSDCSPIETRGRTAYRVLTKEDGTRFLRLCTVDPRGPNVQPTIAPDGTPSGATDGCDDSDFVREASGPPTIKQVVTGLPPASTRKRCVSRRRFTIRLREPQGDALDTAAVFLNGKRIEVRRGDRLTAPIVLAGLPKGRYTVRIIAKTVLGRTIKGTRKYRTCAKKRRRGGSNPI